MLNNALIPPSKKRQHTFSLIQQGTRRWCNQQHIDPEDCIYLTAYRVTAPFSVDSVQNAIEALVKRHQILLWPHNESETMDSDMGLQEIEVDETTVVDVDIRDLEPHEQQEEVEWMIMEAYEEGIETGSALPFRVELYRLTDDQWILLLLARRLVFDQASDTCFMTEFTRAYSAALQGKTDSLQTSQVQYADFSHWQWQQLKSDDWKESERYWRKQLECIAEHVRLPFDRSGSHEQFVQVAKEERSGSKETWEIVERLAGECLVEPRVVLLGIFQLLLHLYSGQHRFSIALSGSARGSKRFDSLIGPFYNVLPLPVTLNDSDSFKQLVQEADNICSKHYKHQAYPVCEISDSDNPSSDGCRGLRVAFRYQCKDEVFLQAGDITVELFHPGVGSSIFDWELVASESDTGFMLSLYYDADSFSAATIRQALDYIYNLIEIASIDPDGPLSEFFSTIVQQQNASLSEQGVASNAIVSPVFDRAEIEFPVHHRFEAQVARYPEKLAVVTSGYQWTYKQLDHAANRIAYDILDTCGEGRHRVALLSAQDVAVPAGMLGILKSGSTYIPIDATAPEYRLKEIVADADINVILANAIHTELARKLVADDVPVIEMKTDYAPESADKVDAVIEPGQPAYLIYTSGSNGHPKGVVQSHRNMLHFISAYSNALGITETDKLTQLSAYGFDAAVMDIYGALLNGATLCMIDLKRESLHDVARRLQEEEVTIYHSTPTVFRYFIESLESSQRFNKIRLVILGGERVNRRDFEIWKKHFSPECRFVNLYGSTESSLSALHFLEHNSHVEGDLISIGFPVVDTEIVLLDEQGRATPLYGEIGIRSQFFALEYWRQEAQSKATFVEDFKNGSKTYFTGDMGRLCPDGTILCLGRKDSQVKVRGFRVEIGDVEAALLAHDNIQQCAVIAVESIDSGTILHAFYTLNDAREEITHEDLVKYLGEKLPDYMVPAEWTRLDTMPLTATGKVDRRRLRNLE